MPLTSPRSDAPTPAPPRPSPPQATHDDVRDYVHRVHERFRGAPEVCRRFAAILLAYADGTAGPRQAYGRVAALFRDEPDLVEELARFLPAWVVRPRAPRSRLRQGRA